MNKNITYIILDGVECIIKRFGGIKKKFMKNEVEAHNIFKQYSWYPKVYEISDNHIIYKRYGKNLQQSKKDILNKENEIKKQILDIIWDIFSNSFVHRDIHGRNFLIEPETQKLVLIDFEFCIENKTNNTFLNSYDIIGKKSGVEPVKTNRIVEQYLLKNTFIPKNIIFTEKDVLEYYEKI